ncbi:MAG: ribonuclease H-like domain-containing protein, partial [Lachnospiraceae bacterium]|nr:ribonuclease H-like domain-containing protein [Lachnospiraceae bacterium]
MKTINTEKEISPEYQYLLSSCDKTGTKPLFFDIETTGFSPRSNMVYLIGLSFPDENKKLCAVQFLAEGIDDEMELLLCFLEMLNKHSDMILTGYNISSFDIPFLNARLLKYS